MTPTDGWDENIEAELDDEASGKLREFTPAAGIPHLKRRIAYLEKMLKHLHPNAGEEAEFERRKQLADARTRLAEFQSLLNQRN